MSDFQSLIKTVPDFPKKGINFKDITPLLKDPIAVANCLDEMMPDTKQKVDFVVGIESRGFILGPLLAQRLNCGFVPIRKKGKLPGQTIGIKYNLEYGDAEIEMHSDAIKTGNRILLHDDVLASGGTAAAALELIDMLGGVVVQCSFIIELKSLGGRSKLSNQKIRSVCYF